MKIEEVAKIEKPRDRFLYWIRERHDVYLRREEGLPKPWTDDTILQTVFFTNPYRELDKTTAWFRKNLRSKSTWDDHTVFRTIAFRWFNLINTGILLHGNGSPFDKRINSAGSLWYNWNKFYALKRLTAVTAVGSPVFTGAYMIKAGNGPPGCKASNVCDAIQKIWDTKTELTQELQFRNTLDAAWKRLIKITHIGPFMAGQIIADLKHTPVLDKAYDRRTWCTLGPGGVRGLNRIVGLPVQDGPPKDWPTQIAELQLFTNERLNSLGKPQMEAQDIQHSLCEFDKYERVLWNDGMKIKRNYRGA